MLSIIKKYDSDMCVFRLFLDLAISIIRNNQHLERQTGASLNAKSFFCLRIFGMMIMQKINQLRKPVKNAWSYVHEEFEALGIPRKNRVSLTEEGLEILRMAWREDEFSYLGKRYRFEDVRVRPRPVRAVWCRGSAGAVQRGEGEKAVGSPWSSSSVRVKDTRNS